MQICFEIAIDESKCIRWHFSILYWVQFLSDILGDVLYEKTTCMGNMQQHPSTLENELHYNLHSLYGWSQSEPTLDACR